MVGHPDGTKDKKAGWCRNRRELEGKKLGLGPSFLTGIALRL